MDITAWKAGLFSWQHLDSVDQFNFPMFSFSVSPESIAFYQQISENKLAAMQNSDM